MHASALLAINYRFISGKYNLLRPDCYSNNLRRLGGGVLFNVSKSPFKHVTAVEEKH